MLSGSGVDSGSSFRTLVNMNPIAFVGRGLWILVGWCPLVVEAATGWTQFDMKRADAKGRYLWTEAANWNTGLPHRGISVEIGDDRSGRALHCVIPAGTEAACNYFELAEHGRTQGTTLRLERGASLQVHGAASLSKDRESWFYVDGKFTCLSKREGIRVGGPWGNPSANESATCHLIIGPSGVVRGSFIGINTHFRAVNVPSSPWGDRFWARSAGSEIVVNGGKLIAEGGLRMSTTDALRPGALRLNGKASFESPNGVQIWCGIWELAGGGLNVRIGDLEMHGNKFADEISGKTGKAVGAGVSLLRLKGGGISTIHAGKLNFVDAVEVDVSNLDVPVGEHQVFDGTEIVGDKLVLVRGTDAAKWRLRFDRQQGDVLLERRR